MDIKTLKPPDIHEYHKDVLLNSTAPPALNNTSHINNNTNSTLDRPHLNLSSAPPEQPTFRFLVLSSESLWYCVYPAVFQQSRKVTDISFDACQYSDFITWSPFSGLKLAPCRRNLQQTTLSQRVLSWRRDEMVCYWFNAPCFRFISSDHLDK